MNKVDVPAHSPLTFRSPREKLEDAMLRVVRAYTFHTPISKGKYRLMQTALRLCRYLPKTVESRLKDGRRFYFSFAPDVADVLYFFGEYEVVVTEIVAELVRPGDTCIDAGANIGLYTTVLSRLCGSEGRVHAFEPVPETFGYLRRNVEISDLPENVIVRNEALGDAEGVISINTFEEIGLGFSSISDQGRGDAKTVECRMTTLDAYLNAHDEIDTVNFVKADIEGAEMMFLRGAIKLFEQKAPPILLMEMAAKQTKNFGYLPNDLIEIIRESADYEFYAVDEFNGQMKRIERFADDDIGANVFCLPAGHYNERREAVSKRFV